MNVVMRVEGVRGGEFNRVCIFMNRNILIIRHRPFVTSSPLPRFTLKSRKLAGPGKGLDDTFFANTRRVSKKPIKIDKCVLLL